MARHFGLRSKPSEPRRKEENDLEGQQDMGGKHGGQAGAPKRQPRPRGTGRDEDVVPKRSDNKSKR